MKDFITTFKDLVEYNTWKNSNRYIEPNATYIRSTKNVITVPPTDYSKFYLTFEAIEDTTFTRNALQYSLDNGSTWTTLAARTALPETTLKSYCYANMFQEFRSLTNAPELLVFQVVGPFKAHRKL